MKLGKIFIATTLVTIALTAAARAQSAKIDDPSLGWYVNANLGANVMQNISASVGGISGTLTTHTGVRGTASVGYNVPLTLQLNAGLEFETGALVNSLSSIGGTAGGFTRSATLQGYYAQMPFLVNGLLLCHPAPRWSLYVGGGGGGVLSRLHVHAIDNVTGGDRNDSNFNGAVQAMAGVRYLLTPTQEFGIGYKYLGVFGRSMINNHAAVATYTFHW